MSNEKKYANGLFAKKIKFQNGGSMTKLSIKVDDFVSFLEENEQIYRDWETDRKSTRLNSSHRSLSRMPSSA